MSFDSVFKKTGRGHKPDRLRGSHYRHEAVPQSAPNLDSVLRASPATPPVRATMAQELNDAHISLLAYVGVKMFGGSLDDKIAAGRALDRSRLLAARAQFIVSASWRQKLAARWLD